MKTFKQMLVRAKLNEANNGNRFKPAKKDKNWTIGCECGYADVETAPERPTDCPSCGNKDIDTQLNEFVQLDESMTYSHTEPATEDLYCEHPEHVEKDVPSTQEHFFKGPDGRMHQIGTCDKHGLDPHGMATIPAQTLFDYNTAAAAVIAKKKQKPEKKYMTNSYKPETSSIMDAYVQAISADADFNTVKEDAEQIDEGKRDPLEQIKSRANKAAGRAGAPLDKILTGLRTKHLNDIVGQIRKSTMIDRPEQAMRQAAKSVTPKLKIFQDGRLIVGVHPDKETAEQFANSHAFFVQTVHGYKATPYVRPTEGGYTHGVKVGGPLHGSQKMNEQHENTHYCAKHVYSEEFGEGVVLEGEHAEPDENGLIEWYSVEFEDGTVRSIDTEQVKVMHAESHENHKKKAKKRKKVQEGTNHTVKYPSSKGEKPLERNVFIPGEEDDSEPHRRKYAKEKDLAAKAGDPDKITQADTLAARLESGIKSNKDPKKVGDMLKLLAAIRR